MLVLLLPLFFRIILYIDDLILDSVLLLLFVEVEVPSKSQLVLVAVVYKMIMPLSHIRVCGGDVPASLKIY